MSSPGYLLWGFFVAFCCFLGWVCSTGALFLVQISTCLGGRPPCLFEMQLVHATLHGPKQCYGIAEWVFEMGWWFGDVFLVLAVREAW